MALLEIRDLNFRYAGADLEALSGVDLSLEEGAFGVIFGPSGSGKSTLLRMLKPALSPSGERQGTITFDGKELYSLPDSVTVPQIGFVMQDPDSQIATDKVWHELAFGLESLGLDASAIRRRVAEIASYFGISSWFHRDVASLSGGQKQILNLASIMVMRPRLLILDEPTAQLDPTASSDLLSLVSRLNKEFGTTVLMSEHSIDDVMSISDQCYAIDSGHIVSSGRASDVAEEISGNSCTLSRLLPASARISFLVGNTCALTVPTARKMLSDYSETHTLYPVPERNSAVGNDRAIISARNVYFRYVKDAPDILSGFSLDARPDEWIALFGANGSGKSTALSVLAGVIKPYAGKVDRLSRVSMVPQDAVSLFSHKTVRDEIEYMSDDREIRSKIISECSLDHLLDRHPFDLSGGEAQRLAIALALLGDPDVLILDEPTKGLDAASSEAVGVILDKFVCRGKAIVMASHDVDFAAEHATRCSMLFDGAVTSDEPISDFFSSNSYYTTAAFRIAHDIVPDAYTVSDVICAVNGSTPDLPFDDLHNTFHNYENRGGDQSARPRLSLWRKIVGSVFALCGFAFLAFTGNLTEFSYVPLSSSLIRTLSFYFVVIVCFTVSTLIFLFRRHNKASFSGNSYSARAPFAGSLSLLSAFVFIPITLWLCMKYIGNGQYYITATAVLILCMLPFLISFERRRPKARDVVTIGAICALGVASRAAFFMVPQFKPVIALCVLTGAAFGAESGFLCGAITMLVSNILFSQGPWTPWQMYAMGIIGFIAGIIFRSNSSRRPIILAVYGAFSAVVIYGGIMNPVTALIWGDNAINAKVILSYYATGLPMDIIHASASAIFLAAFSSPVLEIFERLKNKYNVLTNPERTVK